MSCQREELVNLLYEDPYSESKEKRLSAHITNTAMITAVIFGIINIFRISEKNPCKILHACPYAYMHKLAPCTPPTSTIYLSVQWVNTTKAASAFRITPMEHEEAWICF